MVNCPHTVESQAQLHQMLRRILPAEVSCRTFCLKNLLSHASIQIEGIAEFHKVSHKCVEDVKRQPFLTIVFLLVVMTKFRS